MEWKRTDTQALAHTERRSDAGGKRAKKGCVCCEKERGRRKTQGGRREELAMLKKLDSNQISSEIAGFRWRTVCLLPGYVPSVSSQPDEQTKKKPHEVEKNKEDGRGRNGRKRKQECIWIVCLLEGLSSPPGEVFPLSPDH